MSLQARIRNNNEYYQARAQAAVDEIPALQERLEAISGRLTEVSTQLLAAYANGAGKSAGPLVLEQKRLLKEKAHFSSRLESASKINTRLVEYQTK